MTKKQKPRTEAELLAELRRQKEQQLAKHEAELRAWLAERGLGLIYVATTVNGTVVESSFKCVYVDKATGSPSTSN